MESAVVLVHSPSVGPSTWAPVAARLAAAGVPVVVPPLTGVAEQKPPFHPYVADAVAAALAGLPGTQPVLLVPHSNAGLFTPVIAAALPHPVAGCLFTDAVVPARSGATPVAGPEMLEFLRPLARDGRLPQWTQWWDEPDVAALFPDVETRWAVSAEQPRLPLAFYEQQVPVPPGWDEGVRCEYLLFAPPYVPDSQEAADRGWPVDHLPGNHLHQLVDPDAVAGRILALRERAGG